MSANILYLLLQAFSIAGGAFALWKGGRAERIAALIVIVNVAVGYLTVSLDSTTLSTIRLCNDGLAAVALLVVTLRYAAPWMGGVMLFYASQFSLHAYYLVTERADNDYAHALINNINWNGVIWCLIVGTAVAWRRRSRDDRAEILMPEAAP